MGLYKDSRLTTQGKELITRALVGNTKIIFTNIAFGDGSHAESDDITTLTKLKNQKQLFPISGKETINEKTVHLKFVASNINTNGDSLKEGYFIRELGIYAKPDVEGAEEILYSVAVEISGKGDYMPPYNDLAPSTITMDWYTEVSDAENVLIQASDSAYALAEEFNKLDEEFHNPTFEDSGTASGISNFQSFLNSMKSKMNIFDFFRNLKAGLKYVLHVGSLVNNCVSDNPNLPLAASQGKVLQDQINVLNANTKSVALEPTTRYDDLKALNVGRPVSVNGVVNGISYPSGIILAVSTWTVSLLLTDDDSTATFIASVGAGQTLGSATYKNL